MKEQEKKKENQREEEDLPLPGGGSRFNQCPTTAPSISTLTGNVAGLATSPAFVFIGAFS